MIDKLIELQAIRRELESRDATAEEWLDLARAYLAICATTNAGDCVERSMDIEYITAAARVAVHPEVGE